jgi:hypothetical protein
LRTVTLLLSGTLTTYSFLIYVFWVRILCLRSCGSSDRGGPSIRNRGQLSCQCSHIGIVTHKLQDGDLHPDAVKYGLAGWGVWAHCRSTVAGLAWLNFDGSVHKVSLSNWNQMKRTNFASANRGSSPWHYDIPLIAILFSNTSLQNSFHHTIFINRDISKH